MSSKKTSLDLIYTAGMALTALGFSIPIFRQSLDVMNETVVIFSMNGFQLLTKDDVLKSVLLLGIFIFSLAGILTGIIKFPKSKLLKISILVISLICGLTFAFTSMEILKKYSDYIYLGMYGIIAGWIISITGVIIAKQK